MPFFEPNREKPVVIDYEKYKPVTVMCYTSEEGVTTPLRFKHENPDESLETLEIKQITNRKEFKGGFSYICLCESYGRVKQVILSYYKDYYIWVTRK